MILAQKMNLVLVSLFHPYAEGLLLILATSCSTRELAQRYFRQATPFIPFFDPAYLTSRYFDPRSLMIFDSWVGRAANQLAYPLVSTSGDRLLMIGGNANPDLSGPSPVDIQRVQALYPAPPQGNQQQAPGAPPGKRSVAEDSTKSEQPWYKVEGPGGFSTTVGPVPTAQPTKAPPAKSPTKRWYSLPLENEAAPDGKRPWPACKDGTRTINYCFEDASSHKELAELFGKALAKWAPAMHASSLTFAPDAACSGELQSRCLCSTPEVAETTLHIILTEKGGAPEATIGYLPPSATIPDHGTSRHHIVWPNDPDFFGAAAPLLIAHEIGKAA